MFVQDGFLYLIMTRHKLAVYTQRPVFLLEMSPLQGPQLHLDMSTLKRPVLLLDMSTLPRAVLYLDVSTPKRLELHLDLSSLQRPELSLDLSTLQWLVLVMDSIREIGSSNSRNISFEILLSMRKKDLWPLRMLSVR